VAEVRVHGNVICGASEKVIYRAEWLALEPTSMPRSMHSGMVVDEVDIADLVSEHEHGYQFPHPGAGYVEARIVPDPRHSRREIFDAGRRIPAGRSEEFRIALSTEHAARLIARTVPEHPLRIAVAIDGQQIEDLSFFGYQGWEEATVELPRAVVRPTVKVTLTPRQGSDWTNFHVWIVEEQ
jgi:hypothetical protein